MNLHVPFSEFDSSAVSGSHVLDSSAVQTDSKVAGSVVGSTVSATPTARMKTYSIGHVNVPQQTRHARRIYVGGLPPNFIDEDGLRIFINSVIAQGLGEENDQSYVLSVYINHKKCFAFVELKSIELATASLALDGIMLKNVALRILRANEYKPELVPASMNKVIHFDMSGFQFGNPTTPSGINVGDSEEGFMDKTFDSLVQFGNLSALEPGSIVILGYPYDESNKKVSTRGAGCTNTPKIFRNVLRKSKFGSVDNAEFGADMSKLKVLDVGDVLGGKVLEECRSNLTTVVSELLSRGGVPCIIGGSNDLVFPTVKGVLNVSNNQVVVLTLGSRIDNRLLDDMTFLFGKTFASNSFDSAEFSCDGRYVLFGAQGSLLGNEEVKSFKRKGGAISWLTRDLRQSTAPVSTQFEQLLKKLGDSPSGQLNQAIVVTIDAGCLDFNACGLTNSSSSATGFRYEECLQFAFAAGQNPAVALLQLTEFNPSVDDTRHNLIALEIVYYFSMGYAIRLGGGLDNFISPLGIVAKREEGRLGTSSFVESEYLSNSSTISQRAATVSQLEAPIHIKVTSDESTLGPASSRTLSNSNFPYSPLTTDDGGVLSPHIQYSQYGAGSTGRTLPVRGGMDPHAIRNILSNSSTPSYRDTSSGTTSPAGFMMNQFSLNSSGSSPLTANRESRNPSQIPYLAQSSVSTQNPFPTSSHRLQSSSQSASRLPPSGLGTSPAGSLGNEMRALSRNNSGSRSNISQPPLPPNNSLYSNSRGSHSASSHSSGNNSAMSSLHSLVPTGTSSTLGRGHFYGPGDMTLQHQSSIDLGHDPHPFDESTDLNFDGLSVGGSFSVRSGGTHQQQPPFSAMGVAVDYGGISGPQQQKGSSGLHQALHHMHNMDSTMSSVNFSQQQMSFLTPSMSMDTTQQSSMSLPNSSHGVLGTPYGGTSTSSISNIHPGANSGNMDNSKK